jgi:hypothetical protein
MCCCLGNTAKRCAILGGLSLTPSWPKQGYNSGLPIHQRYATGLP